MSGRRSNYRYGITNAEGILQVLRDVTVRRGVENEFVAISDEPAVSGELLMLERIVDGATVAAKVCVVESRPALVGGSVRHRLRLKAITAPDEQHRSAMTRLRQR